MLQILNNAKRLGFCFLFLSLASGLYALDSVSFSLGGEANGNTPDGISYGGALNIGLDINQYFSLGVKKAYTSDFDTITITEDSGFLRIYPLGKANLFLQAELGAVIYFEDDKSYSSPLGGLAAGWRINIGRNFYLEPAVRGGYPYIWGAGLMAGCIIGKGPRISTD